MKLTFLSSTLFAVAAAQIQAQKVRGGIVGGGRGLEEFDGLLELSMSLSIPADAASAELDTAAFEEKVETSAFGSSKASKTTKTGACDHRLELLQLALSEIEVDWTEEVINEKCHYQPEGLYPGERPSGPNFGCALGYWPGFDGFPVPETWSQGKNEFWQNPAWGVDLVDAVANQAMEMYCECHLGIDEGCAAKLPLEGKKKWVDYCIGAGVWNGDISLDDVVITDEVETCGCYFIGRAQGDIDSCPGVNLGEFFNFCDISSSFPGCGTGR